MTDATPRTLEAIYNRPTRYAVNLTVDGKHVRCLAFTEKKTKSMLLNIAMDNGEEISGYLTEAELDVNWTYSKGRLMFAGNRVVIAFGATERDIAIETLRTADQVNGGRQMETLKYRIRQRDCNSNSIVIGADQKTAAAAI